MLLSLKHVIFQCLGHMDYLYLFKNAVINVMRPVSQSPFLILIHVLLLHSTHFLFVIVVLIADSFPQDFFLNFS